jgi:maleylpyruvate isomerase
VNADRAATGAATGAGLVAPADAPGLARAAADRAAAIADRLARLTPSELEAPSALPGWSRLTIACHLRYGAQACWRMTADARAGRPTAYYPGGRAEARPATLCPRLGEAPPEVIADLAAASARLADAWAELSVDDWARPVDEPGTNMDLGPIDLATLAMLRLTEVDVHGSDLGVGLDDWSDTFVTLGLPFRASWTARRSRQRAGGAPPALLGSWVLQATDGSAFRLMATASGTKAEATVQAEVGEAVVKGSRRDLLALLLGRPPIGPLAYDGDVERGRRFAEAFPGP